MPELPEVETVARQLEGVLIDQVLESARIVDQKIELPEISKLIGCSVAQVFRSGKQVIVEFRGAKREQVSYLAVHLRMTGRLIWRPWATDFSKSAIRQSAQFVRKEVPQDSPEQYTRVLFRFSGGALAFFDVRRFGTMRLFDSKDSFQPIGIEPLSSEFTTARIRERIAGSTQSIKQWLLRQDKIVGLGNIYASEILYAARIHPERPANSLSNEELQLLRKATVRILKRAIKNCGTTFSDFQDTVGETGGYQKYLKVYNREGESCPSCTSPIERIVQQARSTYFCRMCQPKKSGSCQKKTKS